MNGRQCYHLNIQNRSLQGIERAPGRLDIFEEPIIRSLSSPDNLAIRKASTVENPMLDTLPCEVLLLIANEVSALGQWEVITHIIRHSFPVPVSMLSVGCLRECILSYAQLFTVV